MPQDIDADELNRLYMSDRLIAVVKALSNSSIVETDSKLSYILGDSLRQVGRSTDAKPHLQRAMNAEGFVHFHAAMSLSFLHKERGEYHEAASILDALAQREKPMPGYFWIMRGTVAANLEQFSQALEFFNIAEVSEDVDLDEAWLNKAYQCRAMEDVASSAKYAQRVIDSNSDLVPKAEEILRSLK